MLIVNPDLLRLSWYLDELDRRAPELVARAAPEAARLRAILVRSERGLPFDGPQAEAAYRGFLNAFAARAMPDHPVFAEGNFAQLDPAWKRVPYHVVTWLRPDTAYVPEGPWRYAYRPWSGRMDGYVAMTSWLYGESRVNRAVYETRHGRRDAAQRVMASVPTFDPHIRLERVGPLPLGSQAIVIRCARFFAGIERSIRGAMSR
ncbi:MAG: hypothetical protein A2W00_07380 [Candidatus Eisenbacteria bacterium RBG_16_71_46]|nr:MAG: hypothetical protein A2W00_07380 [Candidatus Eisenbacteria bacterium RBG_16_71_46]